MLRRLWQRERELVLGERACFGCGRSCHGLAFDDDGASVCPACNQPCLSDQWSAPADRPRMLGGVLVALAAAVVTGVLLTLTPMLSRLSGLPSDFVALMATSVGFAGVALATRLLLAGHHPPPPA